MKLYYFFENHGWLSWFVPITGLDSEYEYTEFRAMIHYGQQYIFCVLHEVALENNPKIAYNITHR